MGAHIATPVAISFNASTSGAAASLASVFDVLGSFDGLLDGIAPDFADLFGSEGNCGVSDLSLHGSNLFSAEAIFSATDGALKLVLKPGDRYLEFVAAIALNRDVSCDFDIHGWPILSVDGCNSTVAEAGAAGNCSARGGAA